MVRRKTEKHSELTDEEKEMLQEMIITYQSMKMMSRFMKWIAFMIFLIIMDCARFIDAIENIFSHLKKWVTKN
ncbi:hypothetical protein [Bartonella melophagi]|uniref:Uncharacterized protein n=1 Tax=Bartonella melophagi K-2C TaxID=1094557 RepID=J0ZNF1_9HYPH|nr:hypothetical protein [Bartonella melophagi]EJF90038.1 hypothetical protein ME3_00590 [Bartonella melophagi K-2C]